MPKLRSPDSYKAEELYKQGMKLVEIASQLNLPEGTVRRWKHTYKWDTERSDKNSERSHKKGGAPKGNKNAVGHGAPPNNRNAEKYGFFSKHLPEETVSIIEEMPEDPLDVLWDQIQIAYAAIIRAQRIMYVKDQEDTSISKVAESEGQTFSEKWEVQYAWDKQANFLKAQARAQGELRSMIKQYKELALKAGGKNDAIQRLDAILEGLREDAVKQQAE